MGGGLPHAGSRARQKKIRDDVAAPRLATKGAPEKKAEKGRGGGESKVENRGNRRGIYSWPDESEIRKKGHLSENQQKVLVQSSRACGGEGGQGKNQKTPNWSGTTRPFVLAGPLITERTDFAKKDRAELRITERKEGDQGDRVMQGASHPRGHLPTITAHLLSVQASKGGGEDTKDLGRQSFARPRETF